jgi:hypothetical protein
VANDPAAADGLARASGLVSETWPSGVACTWASNAFSGCLRHDWRL